MTLATDPNAAARANAAWSYTVQGKTDTARDALRHLDGLQLLQLQCHAGRLHALAGEVFDEKTEPDIQGLAAALLTPDCPTLPEGVEGYAIEGVHTQVCTWCGRMDCETRFEHQRLHGSRETTWRETAKGTRS